MLKNVVRKSFRPNQVFDDKVPSVGLLLRFYFNFYTLEMFQIIQTQKINKMCQFWHENNCPREKSIKTRFTHLFN